MGCGGRGSAALEERLSGGSATREGVSCKRGARGEEKKRRGSARGKRRGGCRKKKPLQHFIVWGAGGWEIGLWAYS